MSRNLSYSPSTQPLKGCKGLQLRNRPDLSNLFRVPSGLTNRKTAKTEKLRAYRTKGILAQRRNTRRQAHGHSCNADRRLSKVAI